MRLSCTVPSAAPLSCEPSWHADHRAARLPKVTFQVIPFSIGAHPGLNSNFMVLEFDKPMISDIVYVERAVGNIYLESAADLERYKRKFCRLQSIALDPEGSAAMAMRIAATYEDS